MGEYVLKKFIEENCKACGSQRCMPSDPMWRSGCLKWQNEIAKDMKNLSKISHKDLNIGQMLFLVEECGIDCSYFIEPYSLICFTVGRMGISEITIKNKCSQHIISRDWFGRIFTSKDDAIKYCEEMGVAYSFLCDT